MPPVSVSIVVPSHNDSKRLDKCIAAIQNALGLLTEQERERVETIVVDDHSSLPLSQYAQSLTTIVRLERNSGAGAARNAGLWRAKHNYVLFIDSDVLLEKNHLRLAFDKLLEHPDYKILQGPHSPVPANERPSLFQHYLAISWSRLMGSELLDRHGKSTMFFSGCVMVNADFFKKLGGFTEEYTSSGGEEFEMAKRLSELPEDTVVIDAEMQSRHHFDTLGKRVQKLYRRSQSFRSTVGKVKKFPLTFKLLTLFRLTMALSMSASVLLCLVSVGKGVAAWLLFGSLLAIVDGKLTWSMHARHSSSLAIASVVFRQIEYTAIGAGMIRDFITKKN